MGLNHIPSVNFVGSNSAIVGSLGSGESIFRPSERMQVLIQQSVFLLNAKPRFLILGLDHDFIASLAVIGLSGQLIVLVSFAHDQLVVSQTEGIPIKGHRVQVHIGVATFSLAS